MPVRPFISPFRSTVPRAPMPNNTSTLVPPRSKIRATSVPAPESLPTRPQDLTPTIFGTPCFTPNIMSSPMPLSHRQVYLSAAARATAEYISALPHSNTTSSPVAQITLSLPQLNPELDIYDRRFLLQLAWAIVAVTAVSCNLRTRVLVQGSGAFGGIPLSVAGLRRTFDADVQVSRDAWPQDSVQTGTLENEDDLVDDDQIIICLSPTNAVSVPAIQSLMEMARRANGRPVILLNPRLADVPSHSGVMQVSGRADRIRFLESITDIFYLRLLFSAGTVSLHRSLRNTLHGFAIKIRGWTNCLSMKRDSFSILPLRLELPSPRHLVSSIYGLVAGVAS